MNRRNLSRWVWLGLVAALVLVPAACGSEPEPAPPGAETAPLVGADQPASEPTVVAPAEAPPGAPEGVRLIVEPALAAAAVAETVAATELDAGAPPWEAHPAYREIRLDGYVLDDTFHEARLLVYPVSDFEAMSAPVALTMGRLRDLLAEPSEELPDALPFLPPFNAAQLLTAKAAPLSFAGGRGLRFVTQYSQAAVPVNNHELFYTYQGLTDDGDYYVAAILPVTAADLPDTGEIAGNYDVFAAAFQGYVLEAAGRLDGLDDADFVPDLAQLDALVESLVIE